MYEIPTNGDLDRNLWAIIHPARRKARDECACLKVELAARGMSLNNTSLIGSVAGSIDTIHKDALAQAMPMVLDFIERMQVAPKQVISWARYPLENLGVMLLTQIPQAGFPVEHQRVNAQYQLLFQRRLDGALRDAEVGFIGGRSLVPMGSDSSPPSLVPSKEIVFIRPGLWGFSIVLKEPGRRGKTWWYRKRSLRQTGAGG
jgi:hypothetical protein